MAIKDSKKGDFFSLSQYLTNEGILVVLSPSAHACSTVTDSVSIEGFIFLF